MVNDAEKWPVETHQQHGAHLLYLRVMKFSQTDYFVFLKNIILAIDPEVVAIVGHPKQRQTALDFFFYDKTIVGGDALQAKVFVRISLEFHVTNLAVGNSDT